MKKRKRTTKKPSLKNKKKAPATPQSTPIPSLPDDLLLRCFACVSRLYYPTLSLVSKKFPSLLASPGLYKTRSSLGHSESCLYVCLKFHHDPIPHWYTLCRKPDQTLTTMKKKKKKKPSGYALAKLTTPHSCPLSYPCFVTLGSDIYNIGGPIDDDDDDNEPSSSVSILDCRTHTWRKGPSMPLKRKWPVASVLDGKIYVADYSCSDWIEVFDPKTQTWDLVSIPGTMISVLGGIRTSVGIDGKVYFFGVHYGLAYETREGRWESVGTEMSMNWATNYAYCVIENVFYHYNQEALTWYDTTARQWRVLKGVKGLPKFPRDCARLADYGGKMAVLWTRYLASSGYKEKVILCAVIALERLNNGEICGKVEWQDTMLTVPTFCGVKCHLAATL